MNCTDRFPQFGSLVGKTITKIVNDGDSVSFRTSDGHEYKLMHEQDCCEAVYVESIVGDLRDIVGTPLVRAEEVNNVNESPVVPEESYTWTFYKLETRKGGVTIRFFGASNGYYSEKVTLERLI